MGADAFARYMKLRHEREKLGRKLARAEQDAFPVGSIVRYLHGQNWRTGTIQWNESGRVKLLTPSGGEVVIDVERLQP